jgi:hypothetical protein
MKNASTLTEAKRLYDLGFAIHWLKPKEKRPVLNGAFSRPRESWDEIRQGYQKGFNVGVRLGSPSKLTNGYLTCIDVDIHADEFKEPALAALKQLIGDKVLPEVRSGGGHGSRHLYCATKAPISPPITVHKEKDKWEIVVYSEGRQMALPPSLHPRGTFYQWKTPLKEKLPLMDFSELEKERAETKEAKGKPSGGREVLEDFAIDETLDVRWMPEISDKARALIVKGIWKGKKVEDRSAYLLPAADLLARAKLDKNAVLTVLTDPSTYLGQCAYDHAKTKSRKRAAEWLWSYTVKKVFRERAQVRSMLAQDIVEVTLGSFDQETQAEEFEEAHDWRQDLRRSGQKGDGPPKPCLENLLLILENAVSPTLAKRDVFAMRDVYGCSTPWGGVENELITDDDVVKIRVWLTKAWGIEVGKDLIFDALTHFACKNEYDPVVMWLDGLPVWDGEKRLDTWLAENFNAKGEPEYLAQVFRKWLVAMVGRQYEPGLKFDWMPIFEGVQGIGKSSIGRLLVGEQHFLDWLPDLADKDSALALQGAWGVELGELATMSKNDIEVIKGYITRKIDKFRPPFGRKTIEMPRRCVFYGTTNRETYLRDDTGNRRFKPVMVGALDFDALERDRDQLFAEAKWLWDNFVETSASLDTEGKARVYELELQHSKMVLDESDTMADQILEYFQKEKHIGSGIKPHRFALGQLFQGEGPLPRTPMNARNVQFAARALKKLGAESWKSKGRMVWKITIKTTLGEGSGRGQTLDPSPDENDDFYGEKDFF